MASDEAASDDAASDDMTSAASDDAASDDVASGPLVFRSTILQEHYFLRSSLTSGALCLQNHLSFIFFCSLFAHSEPMMM